MPIARLARTRRSLPEGYQFGDANRLRLMVPVLCACGCGQFGQREASDSERAAYLAHRADTLDPDGYGHAV